MRSRLLRLRVAVGRRLGVRPTSHLQGTFGPTWKEGQAAPRCRPQPSSRILTAWKRNSRKSISTILNIRPYRAGAMRHLATPMDRMLPQDVVGLDKDSLS